MSFLQPLGLLGLIAVPIIIIIYIVKSKYTQKPVSSTFIWKRSLKYVKRKIPMSLILSLLLILQILTAITASLAISRPTITPFKSDETIIILDASASMNTTDGEKTRFELAKDKVLEMAKKAGSNSRVSLILAGTQAKTVFERIDNQVDIIYQLENVTCTQGESDIEGALDLAGEIIEKNAGAKVTLITDKEYDIVENLELINVSRATEKNAAIISVTPKKLASGDHQFSAIVTAYGSEGFECAIGLYIDGEFKATKNIVIPNASLEENEPVEVVFTPDKNKVSDSPDLVYVYIDGFEVYTQAKIVITAQDGIADDNEFVVYSQEKTSPKILFISKFFNTNQDGKVDLTKPTSLYVNLTANNFYINSENMHTSIENVEFSGFDLYIFEGVAPPEGEDFPKDGAVWLLNPPSLPESIGVTVGLKQVYSEPDNLGFSMFAAGSSAQVDQTPAYTTITSKVDTTGVALGAYTELLIGDGNFEKIYSCADNQPALLAGSAGSVRIIITAFDITNSSWPMKITDYSLLIGNLGRFSIPENLAALDYVVGDKAQFNAPAGAEKVTVKYDGVVIDVTSDILLDVQLEKVGTYEINVEFADKDAKTFYIPTHISANESNITEVGEMVAAPEVPEGTVVNAEPIEIFPYLIMFLLLLLVVEWGVYHREGF